MANQLDAFNPGGCTWIPPAPIAVQAAAPLLAASPLPTRLRISCEPILTPATSLQQVTAWLAAHPLNALPVATRIVTLETTPPYLGAVRKGPPADQAGWIALVQAVRAHFSNLPGETLYEWRNEPDGMDAYTVEQLFEWWKITHDALSLEKVGGLALSNEGATGTAGDPRTGADYLLRDWLRFCRANGCAPSFLSHHAYGPSTVAQAAGIPAIFRQWMVDAGWLQTEADETPVILNEHNVDAGDNQNKCLGLGLARLLRTCMALHGQWQVHQTLFDTGGTNYRSGLFSRTGIAHPKWQGLRLAWRMVGGAVVAYAPELIAGQPVSALVTYHATEGKWRVLIADERSGSFQTNILVPTGATSARIVKAHKGSLPAYGSTWFPLPGTVLGDEVSASKQTNEASYLSFVASVNAARNAKVDNTDAALAITNGTVPVAIQAPGAALVTFSA